MDAGNRCVAVADRDRTDTQEPPGDADATVGERLRVRIPNVAGSRRRSVPPPAISALARTVYNNPHGRIPMSIDAIVKQIEALPERQREELLDQLDDLYGDQVEPIQLSPEMKSLIKERD